MPADGVPVYIAAGGPVVAKYAGRAGDGFICTSGKGAELYAEKLMPAVAEGAAAAGRSVEDIDKMIEIKISYDPNPELALENTRFWAPLSATASSKSTTSTTQSRWSARPTPCPLSRSPSAGSWPRSRRGRREGRQYVSWGLNHLVFHAPGQGRPVQVPNLFETDGATPAQVGVTEVCLNPRPVGPADTL